MKRRRKTAAVAFTAESEPEAEDPVAKLKGEILEALRPEPSYDSTTFSGMLKEMYQPALVDFVPSKAFFIRWP